MKKTILILCIAAITIQAQVSQDSTEIDLSVADELSNIVEPSIFAIMGEAGAYGELYSTSREIKRRPAGTGRVFLRPTFVLFENFSLSLDLFLSTEGSGYRQNINRIAIHPTWGWGTAHLGDFSHKFSEYSLNGVSIRGAGIEINPGLFRFQIIGGQTQRAVVDDKYNSVYSRYLVGVKIGIGRKNSSFFDINLMASYDDKNSVPTSIFIVDSTASNQPQAGITPKENILAGFNTDLKFFGNMIRFRGEATGSVFTNDSYAEIIDNEDIPKIDEEKFRVRSSTNIDYAFNTNLDFKYDIVNANMNYSTINPGFQSLGLVSTINDKRKYGMGLGLRLFENLLMLKFKFQHQNDNLLGQKNFTLARNTFGVNAIIRPTRELSVMLNYLNNNMANNSANDTTKVESKIGNYNVNITYQLDIFNLRNTIMGGYSYQLTNNFSFFNLGGNKTNVQNMFLNFNTVLNPMWSVGPGINYVKINMWNGTGSSTTTLNLKINNNLFRNKLKNSFSFSYSKSDFSNIYYINLNSIFRITRSDVLKLKVRYIITSYTGSTLNNFWENTASLGIVHKL